MKILITGGTGFLGSHLCDYLINKGNHVICLDNNMTGSVNNIKHLLCNPNFEYIFHDVKIPFDVKVDQIYHLACPASPIHYQSASLETLLTSINGSINMLELAKKYNARILLTSTSEIYGDPLISPQIEEYWGNVNPIGLRSCYDEGKRVSETLFIEYNRVHNVDIRIVRIFNTYGPRLHKNDGRVISNFIIQALENKDITVYGSGNQTRSFCYVDDQIEGLYRLMNMESYVGPINIGNPNELTVLDIANTIIRLTNSESKIIFKSLPSDDPTKRKPDINKAKKYLNWEPNVDLESGLVKTISYFKNILKLV